MSLIADISNPYLGAFADGLFYSFAVCTASCLPIVAGYIAGVGSGFKGSVKITLLFNSGRILAYALIGAIAGLFGGFLQAFVSETAIAPFQIYSSFVFGAVTIIIGVMVLLKARKPSCDCSGQDAKKLSETKKRSRFGVNFGAFSLGLTRGLILCPPLVALLLYAMPFTSPAGSVSIAVLFGLGTVISPLLLLAGVTGWLLSKAPLFQKWISVAGGVVLILLGVLTMLNSSTA
ncbi:MAG: sulfite exporter TauE/SafE family protein [Nitrososphaerota archaeon]|jgi:sulfite exporter TauE/SafE|uniref:sulfite exporter TauE/SafE family protein n=1 Tax=Candidatus Bathycorpusculum sp. TaxID=2994959 RepID=UPI00281BC037|nr:sulfite exporter TauE/SafE family protein [Candidatus Termitimicrobium sp.]MCL2432428.1 sulfite exporter TauE/SafE family protein [Candidatus Termitimicrobium sp.]MDR0492599.1 sulfite exporter TauE/SafE family protein [Nitrososphaerota archaeon]